MEKNVAIARALRTIAVLLDEQGVAFKPAAYRKAADTVEQLPGDISKIQTEKELKELPGIGEAIAKKILEFNETGHIAYLDNLLKEQGDLPMGLMDIEGIGPKLARTLQSIGITDSAGVIKAAEEGKLRDLPRLSETLEAKILANAKRVKERNKRTPRADIEDDVEELLGIIRGIPGVKRAEAAGSYRRKAETIGDIDVVTVANDPEKLFNAIIKLPIVKKVVARGPTKLSFDMQSEIRSDVRCVKPEEWGSALLYFTGSKEHNIEMRKKAIARGWKLNEYGLFEGDKVIAQKEEKDIYDALDLPYYEPEQRKNGL